MDDQLARVIARQRRNDLLFNVLGVCCTLSGVVTLVVLLADLVLGGLGLLAQYRMDVCPAADARVRVEKAVLDGRPAHVMTLTVPDGTFTGEVRPGDAAVIQSADPAGTVTLEGDRLRVRFGEARPGVVQERVDLKLSPEEVKRLTGHVGTGAKARQVFGRFLTAFASSEANQAGIAAPLVGSLLLLLVTVATAVPLGVAAGVYLEEYAGKNWLTTLVEINVSNLASVPSILYGLMALGVLVHWVGRNVLSGGLTLAFLILPVVIVATREALRAVPQTMREAAFALGATRWQVVWHHLLPYSSGGISTGVIIGVSRALGETAPLVTIGAVVFINFLPWDSSSNPADWLSSSFTAMPIQMFNWVQDAEQDFKANAAAAGVVLILCTLTLNGVAIWLRYRLRRRLAW